MADAGIHVIDDLERAAVLLQPLRLRLLRELEQPDSAAGVARRLGMSRQHVNYHMRQLEAAGLLERVGERKRRGCVERLVQSVSRSFVISPRTLGDVAADPELMDENETGGYLVASAANVIDEVAGLGNRQDPAGRPLTAMTVRADVRLTAPGLQRMFTEELSEAVDRVVARYHDEGSQGGRRLRVMLGVYPAAAAVRAQPATSSPAPVPAPVSRRPWSSRNRAPSP